MVGFALMPATLTDGGGGDGGVEDEDGADCGGDEEGGTSQAYLSRGDTENKLGLRSSRSFVRAHTAIVWRLPRDAHKNFWGTQHTGKSLRTTL